MSDSTIQILVCVDFSEAATKSLARAADLVERMHARLHLCHVAHEAGLVVATSLGPDIPDLFPAAQKARAHLQKQLANLGPEVDGEVHVRLGRPVAGILSLIREFKPEMVVICSHGKGFLKRTLLGSVTRQLMRRSPIPVLIVPPEERVRRQPPEPQPPPELPAVGQAVGDSSSGGATGVGISSVGGAGVNYC